MAETRARDTADINETVDALPTFAEAAALTNRNLVYNGAMQVAQRSASVTGITTSGYYTADRWALSVGSLGTWTMTVETDGPFAAAGMGKSLKVLCTTADAAPAASDSLAIIQSLEGQDLQRIKKGSSAAEQLTLSFWVKSNVTGTYIAELVDADNTRRVSASYSISASATWEKKTITFPADTTGGFDNDNALSLVARFWLGAGSDLTGGSPLQTAWGTATNTRATGQTNLAAATDNYWQVTGVQLEVGPAATPFEFKSFGQELRECQRYYYKLVSDGTSRPMSVGFNTSTTASRGMFSFPVVMRTAPTALEQSGTAGNYEINHGSNTATACSSVPTYNSSSTMVAQIDYTVASGLTAGGAALQRSSAASGSSAYLAWSAEL